MAQKEDEMPNYCENDLQFYGEPAEVKKVIDFIAGENYVFDFNKVFQYPEQFKKLDDAANNFEEECRQIGENNKAAIEKLREKYSVPAGRSWPVDGYNQGGYEWCHSTWGTKWNAIEPKIDERDEKSENATYHFRTAWAPPRPVISKLAEMFPSVEFTHEWYERGMAFCGSARYENGKLEDYAEGKYYGIRGG